MKSVISLLVFFILTSCNGNESQNQEKKNVLMQANSVMSFVKTFEGEINNKYPIIVKLKSNSGKIKGNYYYTEVGQELELQGDIDDKGNLNLKEFDEKGNQTGQFEGVYKKGKIEGSWSKPNGKKSMPFVMINANSDYSSVKKDLHELKGISGRYESPFNEGGISSGTVIINHKKGQEFDFEILVANNKGCTGEMKGKVKVEINKTGIFSSSTCKELKFDFFNQELKIQEKDCDEHGMSCFFSGTYKKKI